MLLIFSIFLRCKITWYSVETRHGTSLPIFHFPFPIYLLNPMAAALPACSFSPLHHASSISMVGRLPVRTSSMKLLRTMLSISPPDRSNWAANLPHSSSVSHDTLLFQMAFFAALSGWPNFTLKRKRRSKALSKLSQRLVVAIRMPSNVSNSSRRMFCRAFSVWAQLPESTSPR